MPERSPYNKIENTEKLPSVENVVPQTSDASGQPPAPPQGPEDDDIFFAGCAGFY